VHLTDSVAKRLAASDKSKIHYDDTLRGFGRRVGSAPAWCSVTASTAESTG
jgi:hypothetical protein